MTVQELYGQIGGSYDEAIDRFKSDALLGKFILKFPKDASFAGLSEALEANQTEEAFKAAHTLKGVVANFAFAKLFAVSDSITELLRAGNLDEAQKLFPEVKSNYEAVINAIAEFEGK